MRRLSLVPLLVGAAIASGCADSDGAVELAWVFVDRSGDPIFPGGVFSLDDERSSCDLPGSIGDQNITYDVRAELEICDPTCAAGCDDDACIVLPRRVFACNTAYGNEPAVPASDDRYRFTVRAVISAPSMDIECRDPEPTCVATPAPRERLVEAGLVTDLQVYQIALDVDRDGNDRLDLEACGCA